MSHVERREHPRRRSCVEACVYRDGHGRCTPRTQNGGLLGLPWLVWPPPPAWPHNKGNKRCSPSASVNEVRVPPLSRRATQPTFLPGSRARGRPRDNVYCMLTRSWSTTPPPPCKAILCSSSYFHQRMMTNQHAVSVSTRVSAHAAGDAAGRARRRERCVVRRTVPSMAESPSSREHPYPYPCNPIHTSSMRGSGRSFR